MNIRKELFDTVDSLTDEYVTHWVNFASLESPTDDKLRVDAAADYICGIAREHGWKIEKAPMEKSGDCVCITMNPGAPGKPIALSGHVDTVHPVGLFGNPPVRVEGDTIYGPGVNDCKGGIIAGLLAMDALEREGFTGRPVLLILQTDEETSSLGSNKETVKYMCEKAKDSEAFLNLEGFNYGKATLFRKGISKYEFRVKGKGLHAANCYKGVSAVAEAAHKILELEKMKDPEGITCSVGTITGGTATNSVPDECVFTADIRFSDDTEMNAADETVRKVAQTAYIAGSSCEVFLKSRRVSMPKVARNTELLSRMNAVFEEYGLPVLAENGSKGGSDAADVTAYGIPCIDSLGTHGWDIHSPRERSDVHTMPDSAKRIAAFIWSL